MARLRFGGEEFPLLTEEDLTFAEGAAVCRAAGIKASELGEASFESLQALVWVSIKRRRPEMKFSDLNDVPMSAIEFLEDDEGVGPDPTTVEADTSTSSGEPI